MKLINLTPHVVNVGGLTIEMSGTIARCDVAETPREPITVDGTTIRVRQYGHGEVNGLPDPQDGVGYVVSLAVAKALPQRRDLYIPDERVDRTNPAAGFVGLGQVPRPKPKIEAYRRISADGIVWVWDSLLPQWRGGDCERYDTVEELEERHGRTWHANIPNDRFVAPELLAMILEDRYFAAMDEAGTDDEYDEAADAMKAMGPIIAEGMARRRRRPSDV